MMHVWIIFGIYIMTARQFADIFGGLPLFFILILYFLMKSKRSYVEFFLLIFCFLGFFVDLYLSFGM